MPNTPHLTALPYDYTLIDHTVSTYVDQWRKAEFDGVVAIARGGLVAGVMAACALDIPLYAVSYHRLQRQVTWYSTQQPRPGSRVLVIEDIAGRGTTLSDSLDFLHSHTIQPTVFTLAHDRESRIQPDFGVRIPDGYRAWFPWERESITADFGTISPDYMSASWAIDLDGVLLPDLPEHLYAQNLEQTLRQRDSLLPSQSLPDLDLSRITIITGRPEQDRQRTQNWLTQHGFTGPLIMRNPAIHDVADTATHKAAALLAHCHTHFLESDAIQALTIAKKTQVARIYWWNGSSATRVHASDVEHLRIS